MKKNVLIIARDFAPENIVSAIRPTKLAKYLTRAGYEVTVLTTPTSGTPDETLLRDLGECGRVLRAQPVRVLSVFSRILRRPLGRMKVAKPDNALKSGASVNSGGGTGAPKSPSVLHRYLSSWMQFFRIRKREQEFYHAALNYVQHAGLDLSHFDLMISTYSPMASHMIALAFRAKCPTIRWIADYRDPMDPSWPSPLKRYYRKWQKRILDSCDYVTAASEGYLKMLLHDFPKMRGACLYNGFDPEDLSDYTVLEPRDEKKPFTIVGLGPLYAGRRDVSIVFRAVSDLLKSGRIRRDQILIDYYGARGSSAYLKQKIDELDMPPFYCDHGRVSRNEVLAAQREAQMVLSSAWEEPDYHGVIPGKFSEQLLLRRPIIGVVLGEGKDSEMHRLIHSCRVGYCYEEALGEESYEGLKKYIAESFTYWRTRKRELYEPDEKRRAAFDYHNLIRQWIEVIEDC